MKGHRALTIASVITIALMTIHMVEDAVHSRAGVTRGEWISFAAIVLVLLLGTFGVVGRRAGYVIVLLGGAAAVLAVSAHGMGPSTRTWGAAFVVSLVALAVSGVVTAMMSAGAIWREIRE